MRKAKLISCSLYLLLVVYFIPLEGCSKYPVTTSQKNPADVEYKKKVAATYFWGIINKPHTVIDTTCGKAGLAEVKITTNPGYSLLNIITLGIVHLVKIEWKCQKEPPVIGQQP